MAKTNDGSDPNVRHTKYHIVESRIACPGCSMVSAVFAFALPAGYESLNAVDDEPDDPNEMWEKTDFAAVLSYVEYLSEAVADRIRAMTAHYRLESDSEGGGRFWRNHCEHCQTYIEEELLHGDIDGPFGPLGAELSGAIRWHRVREPFEAWAGGASHDVKALDG